MQKTKKTISELNEDCEIVIHKEIEQRFVNYTDMSALEKRKGSFEIDDIRRGQPQEMQQLYFSPARAIEMKDRCPKMLPSTSTNINMPALKNFMTEQRQKRYVDAPTQATDERYTCVPRSTLLSRTRQHLCKRNSGAQSTEIKYRTIKTQTENCAKHDVSVVAEPLDFIGMFEKATSLPVQGTPGVTKEKYTQMYDHITQSELFCIEWIHKNLFEVKLNPNTLVVDDRLRDHSESACVT
ncbi:hypothetical protein Zmor_012487 [Zophobas morio]|uniref:Uncharacterized protein n=1 Tax=Zophobas morio TaxID=2755281 RepID=A0AA38IDQ8_9CUCU|nr:hypothetical protein Zmor_012487 [Zophobas morio]